MQKLGNKVILITSESLKKKLWHAIDEVYYMPETEPSVWNSDHMIQGFAYLMKIHNIDTVIALDDFDVEKAALIRETFRIQGMGQTTYRYFRDKLAMRQMARTAELTFLLLLLFLMIALLQSLLKRILHPGFLNLDLKHLPVA